MSLETRQSIWFHQSVDGHPNDDREEYEQQDKEDRG